MDLNAIGYQDSELVFFLGSIEAPNESLSLPRVNGVPCFSEYGVVPLSMMQEKKNN